tara:strand:- start:189 stop:1091 length:903 start_codon:yes stop_codon:yes gene_type:complete
MSSKTILSGAAFTPASDIKYSKPKVDARGGKSVGVLNASANSATYISTPLMLTWGVSDYEGNERYEMSLQFPNTEYATQDTTDFMNNMIDFETKIKADAIANAKEWFGKAKMSEDAIDALWTPMLKYPKDKNTLEPDLTRAPILKVKIPFWEGEWKTELYDVDQRAIFPDPEGSTVTPKDLIAKGSHVALVIQCGGLWFANGKFGITWRLFQGVVKPKATMRGVCQIQLSTDDKEKMIKQSAALDDDIEEEDDEPTSTEVEDSDEEEDIKEEVAAAIEVKAPEPVKKKIIKKKVVKKSTE